MASLADRETQKEFYAQTPTRYCRTNAPPDAWPTLPAVGIAATVITIRLDLQDRAESSLSGNSNQDAQLKRSDNLRD
ncbi:MAG: hypothetical protein M2R45_02963 [Verrucomicrobia subdivision 3 bacterium]|nr:hypothetical protein [Limisphaerales bacterium]MCS1415317.1 hypothetical protein [Limisphaerales bacterium]